MERIAYGLEGIVVAATRLSEVDGDHGRLVIGGYSVEELAARAQFEDVLHLLWRGRLPGAAERARLGAALAAHRALPPATLALLRDAAQRGVAPMDALRMGVATLAPAGADVTDRTAQEAVAVALVAAFPTIMAAYWAYR